MLGPPIPAPPPKLPQATYLQNLRAQQFQLGVKKQRSIYGEYPPKFYYQEYLNDKRVRIEYQKEGCFSDINAYH